RPPHNDRSPNGPNGPADPAPFPSRRSDWTPRTGLDARINATLPRSDVVTLGVALEREAMAGTTLDTARTRNDGAVSLQLQTGPERPVTLILGARLVDNERFVTDATYRAGLSA